MSGFTTPRSGFFAGMDEAAVTTLRDQLRQAVIDLVAGKQVRQVQYAQGDGNKMVAYTPGSLADARRMLDEANMILGFGASRRAHQVRFL